MTLRTTLLASLLLLASASYAGAQETKGDEAAADPQWIEFSAPERGFTASFPVKPTETSTPVEGQNPLLQHQYQAAVGEDTVYTVVVFEYPEGKAPNPPDQEYFANVVTAYAKGSESRVRKKGPAEIAGRPGYEASAEDAKRKISHRLSLVPAGDRIFMVVSAGPRNHAAGEDAENFRDSFRLLGADGKPPAEDSSKPADDSE